MRWRRSEVRTPRGSACSSLVFALCAASLAACGRASVSRKPPGPRVVGLPLVRAETVLTDAHLGYSEFLQGGTLSVAPDGRTIRAGWIVCRESFVNRTNVGLWTKRRSC